MLLSFSIDVLNTILIFSSYFINQRLNDDRHVAIVMKNENVDFDKMHQNLEDFQLHFDFDIIQSDSLRMLTEKHHVLFFANEELDVFIAKMLKNQNSIFR